MGLWLPGTGGGRGEVTGDVDRVSLGAMRMFWIRTKLMAAECCELAKCPKLLL